MIPAFFELKVLKIASFPFPSSNLSYVPPPTLPFKLMAYVLIIIYVYVHKYTNATHWGH